MINRSHDIMILMLLCTGIPMSYLQARAATSRRSPALSTSLARSTWSAWESCSPGSPTLSMRPGSSVSMPSNLDNGPEEHTWIITVITGRRIVGRLYIVYTCISYVLAMACCSFDPGIPAVHGLACSLVVAHGTHCGPATPILQNLLVDCVPPADALVDAPTARQVGVHPLVFGQFNARLRIGVTGAQKRIMHECAGRCRLLPSC